LGAFGIGAADVLTANNKRSADKYMLTDFLLEIFILSRKLYHKFKLLNL
tara:strand:- start:843 stop:989 length:147 start_codon:yes stop_codon:yes gene_type:complete